MLSIAPGLLRSCKGARMRYGQFLEEEKKMRKVTDHDKRKKRLREEISGDEEKHRFLKKEIAQLKLVSTHILYTFLNN